MPVYTKIEDSIKETIRQYMDNNPDGAWEDHYNFTTWAYIGEYLTDDPIISKIGSQYDKLIREISGSYGAVGNGELVKLIGEVIADNEYSYLKAWGAIEVYEHIPDYPDC